MPAAYPEELKEKVKLIAFQIGVREAARQCEVPESTVQYWCWDEDWMAQKAQIEQTKALVLEEKGLQPLSTKSPSEIIATLGSKSKLSQAKVVYKTAKAFQKKDGEALTLLTKAVKENIDASDTLFGYTQPTQLLTQVNINLSQGKLPDRSK